MATHQIDATKWDGVLGPKGIAQPGDTIELLPGDYTGRTFQVQRSGKLDLPITIIAQPGAIFDGAYQWPADTGVGGLTSRKGVRALYAGLVAVRSSYVILSGFHIMRSLGRGISIYGKPDKRITNVTVENSTIAYCRLNCVAVQDASYVTVRGNDIHDGNNYISAEGDGVGPAGTWGAMCQAVDADHVVFEDNDVYHGWGEGIVLQFGTEDCTVRRNRVRDTASGHVYADRTVRGQIIDNDVWDTADPAILKGTEVSVGISCRNEIHNREAPPTEDLVIARNVVTGCSYGVMVGGTQQNRNDPVTGVWVHHNTLVNSLDAAIFLSGQPVHVDCSIHDNVFYQPDGKFYNVKEPHSGFAVGPNAYSGPVESVPEKCRHADDHYSVTIARPDAVVSEGINRADYAPLADVSGMGALEYIEPPPPPPPALEQVRLSLSMMLEPDLAVRLRAAIAERGIGFVVE